MTTALLHAGSYGIAEAAAREHSTRWLSEASEEVQRRRRMDLANDLRVAVLAGAASQGSEEAAEEVDRVLAELVPAEDDESLAHLLDPNAKTDTESIGGLGQPSEPGRPAVPLGVERVKVTHGDGP